MMVALAVDVKTVQTRSGHRRATTTLDVYAQPTPAADRLAADVVGDFFLGGSGSMIVRRPKLRVPARKRAMEPPKGSELHLVTDGAKGPVTGEDEWWG